MQDLLLDALLIRAKLEERRNEQVLQKIRDEEHQRDSRMAYLIAHGDIK